MRRPCVAGQFYSGSEEGLRQQIEECFKSDIGPGRLPDYGDAKRDIIGCVVPHAGYVYSGPVAAHVYSELAKQVTPETIILIGFNHRGYGSLASLSNEEWETPLGVVKTDKETVEELSRGCRLMEIDETGHLDEHSLEVQLPFLQYIYGQFNMVALSLHYSASNIIDEIARCLSEIEKDVIIIASSDFTHYEAHDVATKKDQKAISHILNMDEKRFLQTVYEDKISVCGYVPIAACIKAAKELGVTKPELLKYATSGEVSGDYGQVVGYAGIIMRK
jgi:AmmeMemoRadiSam system protein B